MGSQILCFEVSKNKRKLALAGVRHSGVISVILSWVGKSLEAASLAATQSEPIPNLYFSVGGIDSSDPNGDSNIDWLEERELCVGDEIRIRLVASDKPDVPIHMEPSKPSSLRLDDARFIQCSFCNKMCKTEPKPAVYSGVAGAHVFICTRCLVLAERLLDDGLRTLF